MEVNQSTKSETWCTQSFNIYQSGLQNQGWFQKKCKKCQTFVRETSLQSSLKKGAVPYLFVATWTPRYVGSIDSLIGGHLRKETQGLALQQVSGWVMRVMGGLDGWMDANIERCTDGRWQVMSKEIPTSSWMAYIHLYIYINVCYMYTYRVFFLHSIRYIMYASIYLAAVEGHFCQQLLPQVLSSCSARPKKIAQQFPGGPFFFLTCTQFSSNNQLRKIQDPKDFQSCFIWTNRIPNKNWMFGSWTFGSWTLVSLGLVVSRVCQDSSAESDPPRRSSKTASVRKPPETADTAEVWDREEPGDGVRSKKSIVLLGVFLYRLHYCIFVTLYIFFYFWMWWWNILGW